MLLNKNPEPSTTESTAATSTGFQAVLDRSFSFGDFNITKHDMNIVYYDDIRPSY